MRAVVFSLVFLSACSSSDKRTLTEYDFVQVVEGIADGWNRGDAQFAVQYFDDEAVYEEPPAKQLYRGKPELYEFFGGKNGFELPMKMQWHNLAFNREKQIGFGEYTFAMRNQYHGIVVIQFKNGKIIRWREYQTMSSLPWEKFANETMFSTIEDR